jgi:CDP-glucose 4,6-dehydratase
MDHQASCAMTVNPDFWRGKRVFLTGHTGFKGSWLSLWLQSMGAEAHGLALAPSTTPNLFTVAQVAQGLASNTIGDIRDLVTVQKAMQLAQPDIVIHMAAQPLVRLSYDEPVGTYATNVMGTVHVLEAARHAKSVKSIVVVTTDKCYDNKEWVWGYREDEPMGGHDPYSSSKGCAELVSAAYRASFFKAANYAQHGVGIATVRAGNVIGGGDWAQDRLIPDILTAFEQGRRVTIRHPHAIRPWQHVMEPLRGYLALAQQLFENGPRFSEAWNFGPNDEDVKSVEWIVTQMALLWGADAQWKLDSSDSPHEAHNLKLDISKARSRLDWHPALRLKETLALIIEWSKQYAAGANMRQVTMAQLHSYLALTRQTSK